ncbi:major facilitator superfamily domain-containing protein [Ilyonectria sp. MPI-CAGE-AT-0026]|nr:major facilitator superfamily domain-containing protein [Ilyonectria sp. MPI-CAGE-AT-0026]
MTPLDEAYCVSAQRRTGNRWLQPKGHRYICTPTFKRIFGLWQSIGMTLSVGHKKYNTQTVSRCEILATNKVLINGGSSSYYKFAQVRELFLDLNFWTVFAIAFLANIPNGPMSSFVPILLKGMGYSTLDSLLFKMPSGATGFVMIAGFGYLASKWKSGRVYLFACALSITVTSSLLLWLVPTKTKGVLLLAIYLLPSFSAGYGVFVGLQIANTAGYTKKTLASAGIYVGYCLGNFVGPLLFKKEYGPRYEETFTVVVVTSIASIFLAFLYRFQCTYSNKRRDKEGTEESFDNAYEDDFTDRTGLSSS